jgi:tetratricopeptide (TPR) repeat protein
MTDLAHFNDSLVGHYAIDRELGRGGMATVYLARDVKHDRDVALKVLRPELGAALGDGRFLAEIKVTAALQHPNILPLFDSGAAGGVLYYVMPYVRGETLRNKLDRDGPLEVDEAVAIARGIASALDHAHRHGVVHRDIKPENVLLSDGVPMVADFGIARAVNAATGATRATLTGIAIGTPAYMSPEQGMGDPDVDSRADIYALGCLLFEMLTGVIPYPAPTAAAIVSQHVVAPIPSVRALRSSVPVVIDTVIARAMAKERDARFATAAEMGGALVAPPAVEPLPDYSKITEPVTRSTSPLIGRRKEFAELVTKLDALRERRGSMVLIGGEPGVGKTKLTEAVLLEARSRGYFCSVGHCYEMDGAPPYLPFIEQLEYNTRVAPPGRLRAALGSSAAEIARIMPGLRQVFPDIPEPLDLPPDQQRHFLFTQFREFLERATAVVPVVLLFDDLHWADDSTLLLLEYLAPHLSRLQILLLGTYRDVELDVTRPFAKSLERLTRQRLADRIALRRMPEADVTALLASFGAPDPPASLVQAIFAETEGNPFFVEEVFRHLREEGRVLDSEGRWLPNIQIAELEVPEGVRLVIGRRLERVSAECREILTAAAVIGARFDLKVLEAVADVGGDAVLDAMDEAERTGLVIAQQMKRETRYVFAHELIRQTLLSALSVPRRVRRHLRTAEAFERVYAGRVEHHAAELAYHFFQAASAGDEERTTRYLLLAGQQALAGGAFDEALAQADRAFSITEEQDTQRYADLLLLRASALRGLGIWQDATKTYMHAMDRFEALGATTQLVQMTCMLGEMQYYADDHSELVAVVSRVLRATEDRPTADRARLLALGANGLAMSGRFEEGVAMSTEALAMADAIGDLEARAYVLCERGGLLTNWGHFSEALANLEESTTMLAHTGKRWGLLWSRARLIQAYRMSGRNRDVIAMAPPLLKEALDIGHLGARMTMWVADRMARWAAEPHVEWYREVSTKFASDFASLGNWREAAPLFAAIAAFEEGDVADPGAMIDAAVERYHFEVWRDLWWEHQFHISAYTNPDRARAVYTRHGHRVLSQGKPARIGAIVGLPLVIQGLVQLGELMRAAEMYPVCVELPKLGLVADYTGLPDTSAGIAAAAGGHWALAEEHFERALRLAHQVPHVPEQADARYWYAWMLTARGREGDREKARELLQQAMPIYERAGQKRRLRWCEASLL